MPKHKTIGDKFLETLNEAVSRDDVVRLFEVLKKSIQAFRERMEQNMAQHKGEMVEHTKEAMVKMVEAKESFAAKFDQLRGEVKSDARTTMRLIDQKVNDLREEMPEMPMHREMERRIAEVEAKIPTLPEEKDVEGMLAELREWAEGEFKELREMLRRRPIGTIGGMFGGGHTDIGVQATLGRVVRQETPSGAINGSNVTYTVTQPINAVISFAINGQFITDDEYTVAGRTITMDTAIDTSLSGTSFRVTYV